MMQCREPVTGRMVTKDDSRAWFHDASAASWYSPVRTYRCAWLRPSQEQGLGNLLALQAPLRTMPVSAACKQRPKQVSDYMCWQAPTSQEICLLNRCSKSLLSAVQDNETYDIPW